MAVEIEVFSDSAALLVELSSVDLVLCDSLQKVFILADVSSGALCKWDFMDHTLCSFF